MRLAEGKARSADLLDVESGTADSWRSSDDPLSFETRLPITKMERQVPPLSALLRLPSGQFFKPRKKHFAVYEFKLGGHHFKDKGVFLYHRDKIRSRRDKTF